MVTPILSHTLFLFHPTPGLLIRFLGVDCKAVPNCPTKTYKLKKMSCDTREKQETKKCKSVQICIEIHLIWSQIFLSRISCRNGVKELGIRGTKMAATEETNVSIRVI